MSEHTGFIRDRGMLIVISGFSGAGKSAITRKLIREYEHYAYSVSATTRKPRREERDGVDYRFITVPEFEEMIRRGELLEYNRYVENCYGTPKDFVFAQMEQGKDVILEIDVNGARQVKQAFPEAVMIFVTAPSARILAERLKGRGTESSEIVKKRLAAALREAGNVKDYDFLIINDDLDAAAAHMNRLIQDQHLRVSQQRQYLERFTEEMKNILEDF